VDPLIIIAIFAIPVLGLLGFAALIMPLIPIAIYLISLFFPIGGAAGRRKRDLIMEKPDLDTFLYIFSHAMSKYVQ